MPTFILRGVEHVYDAFDEYEHPNSISVSIEGESLAAALKRGSGVLQQMVDEKRVGFQSSGSFFAELVRIEDINGRVLFQNLPAVKGLLRSYGGSPEDHRDLAAQAVFISYSHRDEECATLLRDAIAQMGLRLWFDRDDRDIEIGLIRWQVHAPSPDLDEVLSHAVTGSASLILLLSPNSLASYWVRAEVTFAVEQHRPIFGVVIDPATIGKLPDWLAAAAAPAGIYDFTQWRDRARFDDAVRGLTEAAFNFRRADAS